MKATHILLILLVLSLGAITPALPQTADTSFHDAYPGLSADRNAWRNVAYVLVQRGVKAFYRVHGRWPTSWEEVETEGIFQAPLVGPRFQVIDPDDQKFEFYLDVVYVADDKPRVHSSLGTKVRTSFPDAPLTYSESLPIIKSHIDSFNPDYYLSNKDRLRQLAIIFLLHLAVNDYRMHHGRGPKTVQDVLTSGYSPINETSQNPLTKRPFRFDGSPNDIRVRVQGEEMFFEPVDFVGHAESVHGLP